MEVELEGVLEKLREKILVISAEGVEETELVKVIKVIGMGAEAVLVKALFLGIEAVIKWRFPKPYMPETLDRVFRRVRTSVEARALLKAIAAGVNVPIPLYANPDDGLLVMEYIEGYVLRDIIRELSESELCRICETVGTYVAGLHSNSIVHGDVTTSNIIIDRDRGNVYLIDFGLANFVKRLEDQAIDVNIFFRSIESAHHEVENVAKRCFVNGYRRVAGTHTEKVLSTVNYIRRMGRYVAERKLKGVWALND